MDFISRIYLRTFTSGRRCVPASMVSKRDGASGVSPSEIGAFALSRHYSQGMLRDLKSGERELRHFSILKSCAPEDAKSASLLEGIKSLDKSDLQMQLKVVDLIDTVSAKKY